MTGKFLISAIGGAVAVALFAAVAVAAPGQLGRTPAGNDPGPGLVTNVAHMHMGSPGHSMHMGNVGHSYSRGPMIGSRHAMHAFRSNHIGHHRHHHRRFFFVGVPYYDYYDNSDCWWSKRRHHWVCSSY
jgi:hypothetical protein